MKRITKYAILYITIIYSHTSLAGPVCTQNNNVLDGLVGLDSGSSTIYAALSSHSNECSCVLVRFKTENTDVNSALSILLAAKMANKEVRVDFLDESCNSGYRVYIE